MKIDLEKENKTPFEVIHEWSDELIPDSGNASTVAGEILRAVNKLEYRYFNDGDRIGIDYGNETCNSAARYLQQNTNSEIKNLIEDIWGNDYDDYRIFLQELKASIFDYLNENEDLFNKPNTDDMLNYDDEEDYNYYEEDELYESEHIEGMTTYYAILCRNTGIWAGAESLMKLNNQEFIFKNKSDASKLVNDIAENQSSINNFNSYFVCPLELSEDELNNYIIFDSIEDYYTRSEELKQNRINQEKELEKKADNLYNRLKEDLELFGGMIKLNRDLPTKIIIYIYKPSEEAYPYCYSQFSISIYNDKVVINNDNYDINFPNKNNEIDYNSILEKCITILNKYETKFDNMEE